MLFSLKPIYMQPSERMRALDGQRVSVAEDGRLFDADIAVMDAVSGSPHYGSSYILLTSAFVEGRKAHVWQRYVSEQDALELVASPSYAKT